MPLSWNEIRDRAVAFTREWAGTASERAEAKSFWDEFFHVFGIRRRTVASFEAPVRGLGGEYGFIDLFWRGKLLVEHKSRGADLGKAESQAFRYVEALAATGREDEVPRYIIVSDFARLVLYDLEPDDAPAATAGQGSRVRVGEFPLAELHQHVHDFGFIAGYKTHRVDPEDPANIRAAEIMGRLHDALAEGGYSGHALERLLVRILFCLFADDTGIFEPNAFAEYIENHTQADGSDLGSQLTHIFQILNTPEKQRQSNLTEDLAAFPYVNGGLFAEQLPVAAFSRQARQALLTCTHFDWSRISPAVFGSLFQAVMDPKARRQVGAHYTSERDILKVVRPLFLDDLRAEFDGLGSSKPRLEAFHRKLAGLRFLDPACGCGNFLVVSYRELRLLEMDVIEALYGTVQGLMDIRLVCQVDVHQFYGIEICEFPALIAETALWLMDHQMNLRLSERLGQYYQRLPLTQSATIVCSNALRLDWRTILPPGRCSYVLGNPPFVGKKEQDAEQKRDMEMTWGATPGSSVLDYVSCWYRKAAEYIHDSRIRVGFVSTNSISQGEQVGALWSCLIAMGMNIHFAYRTFPWESEARGKAHVHVIIIGFGGFDVPVKHLYELDHGKISMTQVRDISPYLVEAVNAIAVPRRSPLPGAPPISYGSMANDRRKTDKGLGNLILDRETRAELLADCPALKPFICRFVGSEEFINGTERWCLWLKNAPPELLRASALLRQRIDAVREARSRSGRKETRKLAEVPHLFGEIRQPSSSYLIIPKVSSETRNYIPIGFLPPKVIANGSALIVPGASQFDFGVISSAMHMAWMRQVCGRMKSDYQYSASIVYNNFPWPQEVSEKQRASVAAKAQAVLAARELYPQATLADLYDPLSMPAALVKAHRELDRAVERCYRPQPFASDRQRVEFLFALYERLTAPLATAMAPSSRTSRKRNTRSRT